MSVICFKTEKAKLDQKELDKALEPVESDDMLSLLDVAEVNRKKAIKLAEERKKTNSTVLKIYRIKK